MQSKSGWTRLSLRKEKKLDSYINLIRKLRGRAAAAKAECSITGREPESTTTELIAWKRRYYFT